MAIISDTEQTIRRNTYAPAPSLELTMIANGEDFTRVVDVAGNITRAGIEPPANEPDIVTAGSGALESGKVYAYAYVYAATTRYPRVENLTAAGGSIAPRSNPSPAETFTTSGGNTKCTLTLETTAREDITEIWIYRTVAFATGALAETAAEAGQMFYLGSVENTLDGEDATFEDTGAISVGEQVENDNLLAPTFENVVYYHPYFYGIGNTNFEAEVYLNETGILDLTEIGKIWFRGRSGQFIKLLGIDTGGIDGNGTYYFQYTSPIKGFLSYDSLGEDPATFPLKGSTVATIYGLRATLFRSKPKNPFAWGETVEIGDAIAVRLWNLSIGAGAATALAVVPNYALLQIDTINPNKSYTLSLKVAGSDGFAGTLKPISEQASATSNFCRFAGTTPDGNQVLMGLDCQQFTILQSDGTVQISAGAPTPALLKTMTKDLQEQLTFFGQYDPYHELNCFWFNTETSPSEIDQLLFFHHPSGEWGTVKDYDLTCTTTVSDEITNEKLILGGTSTGFLGRILSPNTHQNWSEATEIIQPINIEVQAARCYISVFDDADGQLAGQYCVITTKTKKYCIFIEVASQGHPIPVITGVTDYITVDMMFGYTGEELANTIVFYFNTIAGPHGEVVADNSVVPSTITFDDQFPGEAREGMLDMTGMPDAAGDQLQVGGLAMDTQAVIVTPEAELIGRWLVLDYAPLEGKYMYARIASKSDNEINCDRYYDPFDTDFASPGVTVSDAKGYIGGIHCRAVKFIDAEANTDVKFLKEFWIQCDSVTNMHFGFHKNLNEVPSQVLIPTQVSGTEGEENYHVESGRFDGGPHRCFGVSIDEKGYDDFTIKAVTLFLNKD